MKVIRSSSLVLLACLLLSFVGSVPNSLRASRIERLSRERKTFWFESFLPTHIPCSPTTNTNPSDSPSLSPSDQPSLEPSISETTTDFGLNQARDSDSSENRESNDTTDSDKGLNQLTWVLPLLVLVLGVVLLLVYRAKP